jgi:hypothetical protein
MRLASPALRASGLVTSTALPAAAAAVTACSCMWLGSPTTTVSTSGWPTASSIEVVDSGTPHRSRNAAPRSGDREYTTCTRSSPRWPCSVIV